MNVVINFKKPKHISSQTAVTKVKHLFGVKKAGHAGTLDPIATGVLIICLDKATKITRILSDLDKEYIFRLKLGERTNTYDSTGNIIEQIPLPVFTEIDILKVLKNFTGRIKQTPPMFSAIKKNGKPLYKLARMGIEIKRPERTVNIYSLELVHLHLPHLDLKVLCSKGTYIRTLCNDIGKALGVGAHMVSLERTSIGRFRIEYSASLEDLKSSRTGSCYSIDSALSHLNEVILDEGAYHKAKNGRPIPIHTKRLYSNQYVRLKDPKNILFGIGKIEEGTVRIAILLNANF